MKRIILAVLTLFATSAFAIGWGNDNPGGNTTNLNTNLVGVGVDVSNRISADSRANAAAYAAGSQANNALTVNQAPIPDKLEIKGVPNVYSGNVYPTAPCMGSSTVGGAGVGFGFSVGSSWTDDECGIRETSRSFSGLGKPDDALKVLCTSKYAAAAPSCQGEVK